MRGGFNKKDLINLMILLGIFLFIIIILLIPGKVYGSNLDWEQQHWAFPEYFRNRFYETGQFFPSFAAELGAGQNIYYFSYYGLGSPFLYISYLLPFLDMKTYIIAVNILMVIASVFLFYIWVRQEHDSRMSFVLSFLFLTASPFILHSHRHIMFVDYIPFLLLTFIFVKSFMQKKGRLYPVIITSMLLVTTSFYYSVGSFLAVGMYALMLHMDKREHKAYVKEETGSAFKSFVFAVGPVVLAVVIAILMSCIILIPTALAILNGRGESGGFDYSMLIPDIQGGFLFYGPYSMGLSFISIYAMTAPWFGGKKSSRLFSLFAAALACFPVIVYFMNGTLYIDGKVLIPFLPIGLMVTGEYLKDIGSENYAHNKIFIVGSLIAIALLCAGFTDIERYGHLVEGIPAVLCFLIYLKWKKTKPLILSTLITAFIVCLAVNLSDNMVKVNPAKKEEQKAVENMVSSVFGEEKSIYRSASDWGRFVNINRTFGKGYYQTTVYSSSCNKYFKDFYLKKIENDLAYRNNSILHTSYNVLYNNYMGVKYYISKKGFVPAGYEPIAKEGGITLYKSDTAYPIGYVSSQAISQKTWESLEYPWNVEALMKYKICESENAEYKSADELELSAGKIDLRYTAVEKPEGITATKDGYRVSLGANDKLLLKLKLDEPVRGGLLLIRFLIDNTVGAKSCDTSITINGVRNRLTSADWRYNNGNYTFDYILDATEELGELQVQLSGGEYSISNIECYTMDYNTLAHVRENMDELVIDKELTGGDDICGKVYAKNDGWLHLSLPYDKGFDIYVDGQKVEYGFSDMDFIGFDITAGEHEIRISYTAPGYRAGRVISIFGTVIFALFIIGEEDERKRNKKNKKDN